MEEHSELIALRLRFERARTEEAEAAARKAEERLEEAKFRRRQAEKLDRIIDHIEERAAGRPPEEAVDPVEAQKEARKKLLMRILISICVIVVVAALVAVAVTVPGAAIPIAIAGAVLGSVVTLKREVFAPVEEAVDEERKVAKKKGNVVHTTHAVIPDRGHSAAALSRRRNSSSRSIDRGDIKRS